MSLNQKFTWSDFLRENPEFKEKKVKRTSPEGKKAFEAAYKAKVKDILKDRLAWIEKDVSRVNKEKEADISSMKEAKKSTVKKAVQIKIGAKDKYLSRLEKMTNKTKQVQKDF